MISGKSISLDNADRLWGMAAVVAAQFFFTTQDMMIKWLSGEYALHQIVLIRAVVGTLLILLVFLPLEGGISALRTQRLGMHLMRGFGIVIANLAYFTSLINIPLGEATAIFFIAPVLITALSVVMLGEKVGLYRWFAVLIGLIVVMIMIRPKGDVFNAAALLPLIAALAYALVHMNDTQDGQNRKSLGDGVLHPNEFYCCQQRYWARLRRWKVGGSFFSNPGFPFQSLAHSILATFAHHVWDWTSHWTWGLFHQPGIPYLRSRGSGTIRICCPADGHFLEH